MIGTDSTGNLNLYSKFTDKKNLTQNREFLSYAYGNYKPQYYNDEVTINKKKKNKLAITILSLSGLLVAVGAIFATRPGNIEKILEGAKTTKDKIQDLHLLDKVSNVLTSVNNLKDDLWDRICKKTKGTPLGFIDKFNEKYSNFYRAIVKKSPIAGKYQEAYDAMIKAGGNKIKGVDSLSFEKFFNEVNSQTFDIISKKRISKGFLNKENIKKLTESNVLDPYLKDVYKKALSGVEIPNNASKELRIAIENFNKVKNTTAKSLVPKLRDINAGAAPTDFINQILIPTLSLGVALETSESKEEKKSTLMNLGIPILTAMTFTQIANLRMLSGLKGMAFGFATGALVTNTLKLIGKAKLKLDENKQNQSI